MWRWQKACNSSLKKRNLVRRRHEVENAFRGFHWVFTPDLAQRLAHEYQQPPQSRPLLRPPPLQSQQSPESRATMMPSPKARPPLQYQQSPQSTATTMLRPRIRLTPLQSQHSPQSPQSPPTPRPRLRPKEEPPHQSPQSPKMAPPPLAAASEVHVVRREEPESLQLMPTPKPTMALPAAAASEVDDVLESLHSVPHPMPPHPKWSQPPQSMAKPVAAAPHHPNLTIAETPEHEDGVAPCRAEAAAARAEAAAARALAAAAAAAHASAAATRANQSPQSPPPKMAPPPLAAASGKPNGPKGRGSVSAELPVGDVHEEKETAEKEEQDPRHSQRSLRSPE